MKMKLSVLLGGLFLLGQAAMVQAAPTATFTISATVPTATGVGITVNSVNSTTNAFSAQSGYALSFDPLTFNSTNSIYLPNHYYALDFGVSNGAGATDVTIGYTEGQNPNGTTNGLGYKTTATFVKEVQNVGAAASEVALTAHGPKKRLIDLVTPEHVAYTELNGSSSTAGSLRVYLGVVTKSSTAAYPDPSNSQPFTAADAPGYYTGSVVVTAVVN